MEDRWGKAHSSRASLFGAQVHLFSASATPILCSWVLINKQKGLRENLSPFCNRYVSTFTKIMF